MQPAISTGFFTSSSINISSALLARQTMILTVGESLLRNSENSSNATTNANVNSHWTSTSSSFDDDGDDWKHVLAYAIPLSCVAIVIVVMLAVGFQRRHRVLEKWSSLTRMRNTNPRFLERAGLRRDSEYDSHNDGFVHVTIINDDGLPQKEPEFRLATIT